MGRDESRRWGGWDREGRRGGEEERWERWEREGEKPCGEMSLDGEAEGTSGVCGSRKKGKEVRRDRGKKCKPGSAESRINGEGRRVEELERAGTIWEGWGKEEREAVGVGKREGERELRIRGTRAGNEEAGG
ncbi:hypothetical protein H8699_09830 [Christensenellaceae bacterium NSJ-44]|uniref:Uncharacterized protein n=1 Tax=Luoshenia tenuis TaxID=2763654 RepID=A0A926HJB5_9FIRM|nr:hypothetical protein [Luoshenia tenuis]MBC8529727.1 hypothetical protein [Luoshenia tenuis]